MESKGGLSTTATDRMLEVGIKELRTKELTNERGSQELYEAEKEREREREREENHYAVKRQNECDLSIGHRPTDGRFGCCGAISYCRSKVLTGVEAADNNARITRE